MRIWRPRTDPGVVPAFADLARATEGAHPVRPSTRRLGCPRDPRRPHPDRREHTAIVAPLARRSPVRGRRRVGRGADPMRDERPAAGRPPNVAPRCGDGNGPSVKTLYHASNGSRSSTLWASEDASHQTQPPRSSAPAPGSLRGRTSADGPPPRRRLPEGGGDGRSRRPGPPIAAAGRRHAHRSRTATPQSSPDRCSFPGCDASFEHPYPPRSRSTYRVIPARVSPLRCHIRVKTGDSQGLWAARRLSPSSWRSI